MTFLWVWGYPNIWLKSMLCCRSVISVLFDHYLRQISLQLRHFPHILLLSYSTEVFFTNFAMHVNAQREWLIKDLEKANRNRLKVPWVIVFGHRPLYCSTHIGDDCSQEDSRVRNGYEPVTFDRLVTLFFLYNCVNNGCLHI